MPLETRPFESAEHLESPEAVAYFLEDAIETSDPAYIAHAISKVAYARGLTQLARELGLPRAELTEALFGFSGPNSETLLGYVRALGARSDRARDIAAPAEEEPAPAVA